MNDLNKFVVAILSILCVIFIMTWSHWANASINHELVHDIQPLRETLVAKMFVVVSMIFCGLIVPGILLRQEFKCNPN